MTDWCNMLLYGVATELVWLMASRKGGDLGAESLI